MYANTFSTSCETKFCESEFDANSQYFMQFFPIKNHSSNINHSRIKCIVKYILSLLDY